MSPRGVAIEGLRERLFAAAERVLAREGAVALTSRAVTEEAECAKGVLHTHFAGLDEFVAELVLYRFGTTPRCRKTCPPERVPVQWERTLRMWPQRCCPWIQGRWGWRCPAARRVREAWQAGAPGFTAIQEAVSGYLRAEQELGRVATPLDVESVALALVGTLHHLLMTSSADAAPASQAQVERLIHALICTA
ncbi:TetR/AcrR family transcriptional regulator [Streptomyces sp. NPDC085524]|uniref:TetR/AcrR family transcriptional regulator n=1 Tax=Streptomyces sp. NPDC085524 TaxID=3365728 RepID=UPI0037D24F73